MIQAAKIIETGLATTGLIGAGLIGVVFGGFNLSSCEKSLLNRAIVFILSYVA
jgi:hypothetical protein